MAPSVSTADKIILYLIIPIIVVIYDPNAKLVRIIS